MTEEGLHSIKADPSKEAEVDRAFEGLWDKVLVRGKDMNGSVYEQVLRKPHIHQPHLLGQLIAGVPPGWMSPNPMKLLVRVCKSCGLLFGEEVK